MTVHLDGNAVARSLRANLTETVEKIAEHDVVPTLATVLMNDDPASASYVQMKHEDCREVGIDTVDPEISADDAASQLHELIEDLNTDQSVNGILVQLPLPDHVEKRGVIEQIAPRKDVDGFHPENLGRLVAGYPRFKPCTPHGIQLLLEAYDIETAGQDIVVVGRSNIVGKPMANLLLQDAPTGNATTTVCHSQTADLAAHTTSADIIVAAAGVPELIDETMVTDGTVVIDVGINRVTRNGEETLVGDVAFEAVEPKTRAITPVPGGVGPMTRALLLYNTVKATIDQHELPIELPEAPDMHSSAI